MSGFPEGKQWLGFILAVFVASVVIGSIVRRVPALASIAAGV